ncbi:MAG: histidine phosphatase family protein [Desulfobulbaceae bacterium]|nr:histidine phosphatase family protein [Desulfobulbaceae bacterium]
MGSYPVRRFFFVRHAEVEPGMRGKFYGWSDPGLSEIGLKQAIALGDYLHKSEIVFSSCYMSDSNRCKLTYEGIAKNSTLPQPLMMKNLRERNFGDDEGATFSELISTYPDFFDEKSENWLKLNSGESVEKFCARSWSAFQKLKSESPGENALVLTHSGVIRAIVTKIMQGGAGSFFKITIDNCSISLIEDYGDNLIINSLNNRGVLPWTFN